MASTKITHRNKVFYESEIPARILVADNSKTIRELLKSLLTAEGHEVVLAKDGEEAINLFDPTTFDLVLLDVMMPKKDGFAVLEYIREELKLTLFPVIIITSRDETSNIIRAFDLGATDYVTKPFVQSELLSRVEARIRKKRFLDQLDDAETVLFALARLIEAKDSHTGDHCDRLAHMAIYFGKSLKLPLADLQALWKGSILHDIGKVTVPDRILLKPSQLNEDEWKIMRKHTLAGKKICEPLVSLKKAVDIIASHHERWDGSGYPQGLKGDEIPLLARNCRCL